MTKVAVITRTKDRSLFLKRAIRSVATQTYQDYIHVIVNDGGDVSEVDDLVNSQPDDIKQKIKVVHRSAPSNAPDAIFNESIDQVSSSYVAVHDDDDTWHPEFLERTVAALDGGANGVVVRTDNVYEEVVGENVEEKKTTRYMPDMRAVSLYAQCLDNQLTACAFVYRRDAYEAVGKYDDTLPVVGDWEFGIRFLLRYDVEFIDPGFALAFYHRRLNADNSFKDHDHRKNITKVFNKYLRQDLESGRLGVGYIMNNLWFERDSASQRIKKFVPAPIKKMLRKKTSY